MYQDSMIQMIHSYAVKLDQPLCAELLGLHQSFSKLPRFLKYKMDRFLHKNHKLPVIIEWKEGNQDEINRFSQRLSEQGSGRVRNHFERIGFCSAEITPSGLKELLPLSRQIHRIYLNRKVHVTLNSALQSANARKIVRSGLRLTGKGVTIAIIDTGIYPHPDLEGRIAGFTDFIGGQSEPYDDHGHGTHCAGDAAGSGKQSDGKYAGPAPESRIYGIKVLDKHGNGTIETILQGLEWCIRHNEICPEDPIDIISLSIGTLPEIYPSEIDDPVVKSVNAAWEAGITVCVSAGNEGPAAGTITSPGISSRVITVGALDDKQTPHNREDDEAALFSGRGPTPYGISKPDLLVPGARIVSLRAPRSYLDRTQKWNRVGDDYFELSGTSMATPICAGIAALIKQSQPGITPDGIKQRLLEGTDLWQGRDPNIYGAGYINAERSVP
ncbi:serine protease [Paenibacillus yonginensis]|uniref:Serine protease n=1 Tax=Paenibacillus yonginensis TaxID=1462996 RepID=A0A1B1N6J5_9BACL|nr:S8 family peptidase [Paenibacillus yonginensis]ANS77053.1 serine protease [Paenibacillus yonginensis]